MSAGKQFDIEKSEEDWKRTLSPEQFQVLRQHGTERAGASALNTEKRKGMFHCAGCGAALFDSDTKYESGSGWPSFTSPLGDAVETSQDKTLAMSRTEVHCTKCGGHLGHVFDDGPAPSGLRYCMNGAALNFDAR
ncbi:MAG TPA: peptide-methionine (R)-S-oxide reductase MsrB [Rhizomicrobium sp.]